jgi:hypothetical protein
MEVLYPRCAGLDVHAASVTACVRIATAGAMTSINQLIREFHLLGHGWLRIVSGL